MATNPSMAPGTPDDENGIAVQVRSDYIPNPGEKAKNVLQVTRGELGWAFKSSLQMPTGWIICQIGVGKAEEQKVGWVNIKWLNKGNERVRPLPIDTGNSIVAPPTTLPGKPSCLEKTVHSLWKAIQANRTTIEAELPLSPEISSRLFGPNTSHYPNEIMRAFTPAARELMASGVFHPRDFSRLQALSKTAPFPEKPGIYVRVYPGIESPDFLIFRHRQKPPSTGLYSGQTIGSQWPTRFSDHDKGMAGSKAQHYRLARTCDTENVAMIPIILFDENQPMVRVLTLASCLSAAELTMVCLFKSWFPLLLGPTPLNTVAAYIVDFRSAKVFANIIDIVKSRTGWNPNEIVGCNWQTPVIRDIDMELTWCSWFDYEKDMKVFRCRRRLFVRLKKNGTPEDAWVRVAQNENLFLPVEVLNQSNLVSGQAIHVVVEFMANGMDHPSMWVRFPRIGPNPELEILRSMAIRIEWTDASGQWFTCALTRSKIWTYIDNDSTKIPTIYRLGMTLAKILQCINYTGAPEWMPTSIGRVVVKEFIYEHLKQQLIAINAQSRQKQWPADYTMQQNTTRLQTLVNSKGWPTSVGIRPGGMHRGRQACDICVSQASTTPCFGGKCNFDAAMRTCSACRSLRRPCTFTDDAGIVEKLQTDAIYSELGMATNVYYMTNEASIRTINPPFEGNLDQDQRD